jgi:hypothetical protein
VIRRKGGGLNAGIIEPDEATLEESSGYRSGSVEVVKTERKADVTGESHEPQTARSGKLSRIGNPSDVPDECRM